MPQTYKAARDWPVFSCIEEDRAWQLTVERSYRVMNLAQSGASSMHRIKQLADDGDPIAIGIMAKFMAARMAG